MSITFSFNSLIGIAFALIGSLVSYTLILLILRFYVSGYTKRKREQFSEMIALEVCDYACGETMPQSLKRFGFFERKILQEQLLESIRSMTGSERIYLIDRYKNLGFIDNDIRHCDAYRWEKRLLAVVHLGYLELNELGSLFAEMIEDRNKIVSSAAALAFTALDYTMDNEILLAKIPPALFERKDVLSEIMFRISVKEPQIVIKRIQDPDSNPLVKECCIRAMLREGSFEAVQVLTDFLNQSGMESQSNQIGNIALAITGLQTIGDTSACGSVRRFLRHPVPKIRALAVHMLTRLQDPETAASLAEIENDDSIEVQRAISRRAA